MNRPLLLVLAFAAGLSPLAAQTVTPKIKPSAPIKDLSLPAFDKNGKRAYLLRAGEAFFVTSNQIDVKHMHFTLFTKDGTGAFDTVLLAPSATFLTQKDKEYVSGKETVRIIRLNLEVTGEDWSYNHAEKRVLIGKNARVTFLDELKDIIK